MADDRTTVEILLAYSYSKEDAAKAARLVDDFQDKAIRATMSKADKIAAQAHLANAARNKKRVDEQERIRLATIEASAKKEIEIARKTDVEIRKVTAEQAAYTKKSIDDELKRREAAFAKATADHRKWVADTYGVSTTKKNARGVIVDPASVAAAQADIDSYKATQNRMAIERKAAQERKAAFQSDAKFKREQAESGKKAMELLAKASELEKQVDQRRLEAMRKRKDEAKKLRDAEAAITKEYSKQMREVEVLRRQSEILGRIGQGLFLTGAATVGGIFALGNKEAGRQKDIGKMTAETEKWLTAQLRIEKSSERIGRVAEATILPYLEKAAAIAEKVSKFVERHPETLKALLSAGAIAATLGSVLTLASKGIRIYADLKYEAAQLIHAKAMDRLTAAMLSQSGAGSLVPKGTGAGALASKATALIAAPIIAAVITKEVGNALQRAFGKEETGWLDIWKTAVQAAALPTLALVGIFEKLNIVTEKEANNLKASLSGFVDALSGVKKTADAAEELSLAEEDEAEAKKILADLTEDVAKAERKLADDREDIAINTRRALEDADRELGKTMNDIATTLTESLSKVSADLEKALAKIDVDFAEDNIKIDQDYQDRRAEIIKSGNDEILRIQQSAKKELERLERDHNRTRKQLIGDRDALGLFEEDQAYQDRKDEIRRNTQDQIEQARANNQAQLEEAARNYEEQRQQRLEEYEKQKAEARQHAAEEAAAAKQKAEEDKKKAAADDKERREEIARRQAQDLEDLKRQFDNEQRERVLAANASMQLLGDSLNAELELRRQYYDIILADLNSHMAAVAAAQSPIGGVSTGAGGASINTSGGTSGYSAIRTPSSSNADLIESLARNRVMQSTYTNNNGGVVIRWDDHRVFSGDISPAIRQQIVDDSVRTIDKALEKAKRK